MAVYDLGSSCYCRFTQHVCRSPLSSQIADVMITRVFTRYSKYRYVLSSFVGACPYLLNVHCLGGSKFQVQGLIQGRWVATIYPP